MGSSLLFPAGWIIVNPLARKAGPSVIHALKSVGKTTTAGVVVFYWYHHIHHSGDIWYGNRKK
jgi:hypothetical protein